MTAVRRWAEVVADLRAQAVGCDEDIRHVLMREAATLIESLAAERDVAQAEAVRLTGELGLSLEMHRALLDELEDAGHVPGDGGAGGDYKGSSRYPGGRSAVGIAHELTAKCTQSRVCFANVHDLGCPCHPPMVKFAEADPGSSRPQAVSSTGSVGSTPGSASRWRPGVTLDPFAGSGTTLAVADLHGRDAIGIDFNSANKLIYPARYDEVKRALFGTPAPMPGQGDLFADEVPA